MVRTSGGTTPRRRKCRDCDAVYYMGVHNRRGGGDNPPVPAVIGALQWYGLDLELLVEVGVAGVRTDTVEQTIADVDVIGDDSVMSK